MSILYATGWLDTRPFFNKEKEETRNIFYFIYFTINTINMGDGFRVLINVVKDFRDSLSDKPHLH